MKGAILATVLALCVSVRCATSVDYTATVVEYRSIADEENTVLKNIDSYVATVSRSNADIVVFPEYGLTTLEVFDKINWKRDYTLYVPKRYETLNLCEETSHVEKALRDISCVAIRKKTYVVINFIEKDNSTSEELFYNTNLVFDRAGKIAAKYRKINLYDESELTPGTQIVTFDTDFGVKFGIFTCFDILFKNPAADILTSDIKDIIYPTAWISQTPFGISLSVQAGYVKKNRVNLLAANYNNPSRSNGGSGIYHWTGVNADTHISGQHTSSIITKKVHSIPGNRTCEFERSNVLPGMAPRVAGTIPTLTDYITQATSTDGYVNKYKDLPTGERQFKDTLYDGSLYCTFEASTSRELSTATTGTYKWVLSQKDGATSCALVFCKTKEDSSCGERIDQDTNATFEKISVKGNFPKKQYTMPITSRVNLLPIYAYSYCAKDTDADNENINMEIYESFHENVTAFGIVGYLTVGAGAGALWGNAVAVTLLGLYAILRNYI